MFRWSTGRERSTEEPEGTCAKMSLMYSAAIGLMVAICVVLWLHVLPVFAMHTGLAKMPFFSLSVGTSAVTVA